jgi:hypothetical protein
MRDLDPYVPGPDKEAFMVRRVFSVVAGLVLAGATAGWASPNPRSVRVVPSEPMAVSGKTLAAGSYQFYWTGDASQVDVTVKQGDKVVTEPKATV